MTWISLSYPFHTAFAPKLALILPGVLCTPALLARSLPILFTVSQFLALEVSNWPSSYIPA